MAFGDSMISAMQLGDQRNQQNWANIHGGINQLGNYFGSLKDRQQKLADARWNNFKALKEKYSTETDTQIEQRLNEQEALRAKFQNEQKSPLQRWFDKLRGRSNPHFDESILVNERLEAEAKKKKEQEANEKKLPESEVL